MLVKVAIFWLVTSIILRLDIQGCGTAYIKSAIFRDVTYILGMQYSWM